MDLQKTYLVLLVDRKQVKLFTLTDGVVKRHGSYIDTHVPQRVRKVHWAWMRQDKVFRHIEDHIHRHLLQVAKYVCEFSQNNRISGIIIGGHREFFVKMKKHLPLNLRRKVKATFITELKGPFNKILKKAKATIHDIEEEEFFAAIDSSFA